MKTLQDYIDKLNSLNFKAKQVAGRSEREAGTCGVVTEDGDSKAALEYFSGDIVFSHETESISYCEYCFEFFVCFVPHTHQSYTSHIKRRKT